MTLAVETTVLTTLAELRALHDEWENLWRRCASATPFQHPAWLCEWVEQFQPEAPRVLLLRSHQRLVGLVPTLIYREGERRILGLLGGGVSDYLDALFDDAFADAVPELLRYLERRRADWDECRFELLRSGSSLLGAGALPGLRAAREQQDVCSFVTLPARAEALEQRVPSSVVSDANYNRRRLQRQGELRAHVASSADVQSCLDELLRVHGARWRARAQHGMLADPAIERFHRRVAPALIDAGLLRLQLLRFEGRAIAATYVLIWQRTAYCYLSGFDPEYRRFSPGKLALLVAMEGAIAEGCTVFDCLRGSEPYKRGWGAVERPLQRWRLLPLMAAMCHGIEQEG